jgi:hypothetical protein
MPAGILLLLGIVLLGIGFIIGPMGTLWALNTISEEAKLGWYIPHDFWTYLPIWLLMILWRPNVSFKK